MSEKIITLSGAATDVLYALFFRGALLSGDLPSKSGTAELRELGFAETRHTATEYQKENHFTFLTSEGQKFAVEHLVNTRFGKQQYCASMALGVEIDTTSAQKAIDDLANTLQNLADRVGDMNKLVDKEARRRSAAEMKSQRLQEEVKDALKNNKCSIELIPDSVVDQLRRQADSVRSGKSANDTDSGKPAD
ncbi:hypothetical protein B9H72_22915 [Salmonella enterica]|nr:hypothetical protein [Salmonella enterica]